MLFFIPGLFAAMLLPACHEGSKVTLGARAESPAPGVPVSLPVAAAPQAPTPQEDSVRLSGTVTAIREGQGSFRVGGHIAKVTAQEGDQVKKAQLLAVLEDEDASLRLRSAKLGVGLAKVSLEQAKRDHGREEQLARSKATTDVNLEKVRLGLENAKVSLEQAEVALAMAEKGVQDTRLCAPYDAVVTRRHKVEGDYVAPGAPVFELTSRGDLEVTLKVAENFLKQVVVGARMQIYIPSTALNTAAEIVRVVPVVEANSRTFSAVGKLPGGRADIVPGQFVEARL